MIGPVTEAAASGRSVQLLLVSGLRLISSDSAAADPPAGLCSSPTDSEYSGELERADGDMEARTGKSL